jgi:hypothetical protein
MQGNASGDRRIEFNQFFVAPQSAKTNRTLTRRDKKLNSFLDDSSGIDGRLLVS